MHATSTVVALATIAGALTSQQQILLPDNHHLSELQSAAAGTTSYWATTVSRRFQILYDGSIFVANGVSGPITINELAWRGEDGEVNKGGQVYTGITVSVYSTTLASAVALSTTFANNLPPVVATSTLLGTNVIASLTLPPSMGLTPSEYIWTLPVAGLLPYDPTSAQPNLLVEVTYTGYTANIGVPPVPNTNALAVQDTTGTTAQIRGRGLSGTSSVALTGTGTATPPIMRVGFSGLGGYTALTPARVESFGAACGGSPSGFYEVTRHTQSYDLKNPGQVDGLTGLTLTPDVYPAPNFYTVTGGAAAVDLVNGVTGVANSTGDDTTYAHALAAAFDYPGGTTMQIRPSTNGYVIVSPGSTETAGDFSCSIAEWLNNVDCARFAPCWHDFHAGRNSVSNPGAGLYSRNVVVGSDQVCLVTWNLVGSFDVTTGDNEKHTLQCSINCTTGVVEFRYGAMSNITADTLTDTIAGGIPDYISCITGFTRGQIAGVSSVDPQSRDLSIERPFSTKVEGASGNMGLTAVSSPAPAPVHYPGRMYRAQSITWNTTNVPAGSLIGALLIDVAKAQPGFQSPGFTAPGCMLSMSNSARPTLLWEVTFFPTTTVTGAVPVVVPGGYDPAILGAEIVVQYAILDGIMGAPSLITAASNALLHTVGLQ